MLLFCQIVIDSKNSFQTIRLFANEGCLWYRRGTITTCIYSSRASIDIFKWCFVPFRMKVMYTLYTFELLISVSDCKMSKGMMNEVFSFLLGKICWRCVCCSLSRDAHYPLTSTTQYHSFSTITNIIQISKKKVLDTILQ